MNTISLAKILRPPGPLAQVISDLLLKSGSSISIQDTAGKLLMGHPTPTPAAERFPILFEREPIGWVLGESENAAWVARLLGYAADQEGQKKSLAAELIERYRELNLLYHLSEHLSSSPTLERIAEAALQEAIRMIPVSAGMILLKQDADHAFRTVATWGQEIQNQDTGALVERVFSSGKAELTNAQSTGPSEPGTLNHNISLACAPLKTEKSILGVVILVDCGERIFSAGDLKLLNTIAMQSAPAIEISRLYRLAIEKAQFERELQMARQVQESLLPLTLPHVSGWEFSIRWQPAREVSGDFYDFINEGDHCLGLVIADITGKGLPASLFMVFVRSALRASIAQQGTPAEAITRANQLVCQDSHESLFATLVYTRLKTDTGELEYVNAGHNPPLLYRSGHDDIQLLKRTGVPLGMDFDSPFSWQTTLLNPGDFILFYTDGVTESIDPDEQEFGLERLIQSVYKLRDRSTEQILDGIELDLVGYTRSEQIFDDITLMIVKRTSF
jgi:phosphoserine phosphatase RsbU/P